MRFFKFFNFILFISLVSLLLFSQLVKASTVTSFNSSNIISNAIFSNTTSMTANQIDIWLNSNFGSTSCISTDHGFSAPDPIGYSPSAGFTYGSNVSAGRVIYDAAQAYQINPQVLLTTMEKEQSLVSGNTGCGGLQYTGAMGYGCPDGGTTYSWTGVDLYTISSPYSAGQTPPAGGTTYSSVYGTCVDASTEAGFSQQVIHAAWLLAFGQQRSEGNINWAIINGNWDNSDDPQSCYSGPMIQGTWQICPNGPSVYYNGVTVIDGVATQIDNGATAALYWYTPHFSGNQNFDNIFQTWFGPTHGTKILAETGNPTFYVYSAGKKIPIPSQAIYDAYGFQHIATTLTSSTYLNSLPTGPPLSNLSQYSDGTIQFVDNGNRYSVTPTICTAWGLACSNTSAINTLDNDMFSTTTWQGNLQPLMYNNGMIFKMDNGMKDPFLNMTAITQNNYTFSQISNISNLNANQPLGPLIPSNNTTFRLNNGNIIYYTNGQIIGVSNINLLYEWGLINNYYSSVPPSLWDTQSPTLSAVLSNNYIGYGSTKILVDNGRKLNVSSDYNNWPMAPNADPYMGNLLNNLALVNVNPGSCFQSSNGNIFTVQGGVLRSIRLIADLYIIGCQPSSLISINQSSLSQIPVGPDMLTQNRLFQVAGSPAIYMVTGPASSVAIPNYNYIAAFGQSGADIAQVSSSTLNYYTPTGSVSSLAGNYSTGTYFLYSPLSIKYYFNSSVFADWGINKQNVPTYVNAIGLNSSPEPATQFARTPSGSIYYGSGGSAHLINSYSAFLSLGGTPSNTMNVLNDFIANVPVGNSIN